jgi:hypothetical protein
LGEAPAAGAAPAGEAPVAPGAANAPAAAVPGDAAAGGGAPAAAEALAAGPVADGSGAGAAAPAGQAPAGAARSALFSFPWSKGSFWPYVGNLLQGISSSGLHYDIGTRRTFTAAGYFEALGWGALSAALGGFASPNTAALSLPTQGLIGGAWGALTGAGSSAVTTMLSNADHHQQWNAGLVPSVNVGAREGAAVPPLIALQTGARREAARIIIRVAASLDDGD